jgi:hypothetical protein
LLPCGAPAAEADAGATGSIMSTPPRRSKVAPAWAKPAPRAGRIDIADTPANAVFKLVLGDRASAEACIAMVRTVAAADPDAEFGPFTPLLILDTIGLVGPAIGTFYSSVCAGDPVTALAVLHALRLRLVTPARVRRAMQGGATIDAEALLDLVRHKIPRFGRPAAP